MNVRRRFLLALVASIVLHLSIVVAPGWLLPSLDDLLNPKKVQRLDAWLSRAAAAPTPPAKPRKQRPKAEPRPDAAVISNMPVPPAPNEPAPEPPGPTEPAVVAGQENPPAAAASTLPPVALPFSQVRIQYAVNMGDGGLMIGQAVQDFRSDGVTYTLRSATGTSGLARLFKRVDVVHTSTGDVVDGKLRPREFKIERDGQPTESAAFDWIEGQQVWLKDRHYPLETGTQDMLSLFCELSLMTINDPTLSIPVVTGKKVERYEFAVLGDETLATPMGDQPTVHLRYRGEGPETTDVWLGLNFARLPIRIRYVDRKGELFDQIANSVEVETGIESPH